MQSERGTRKVILGVPRVRTLRRDGAIAMPSERDGSEFSSSLERGRRIVVARGRAADHRHRLIVVEGGTLPTSIFMLGPTAICSSSIPVLGLGGDQGWVIPMSADEELEFNETVEGMTMNGARESRRYLLETPNAL
ncbi:hypothetical protein Scep_019740 [Stephania cephalantha]|uniref:Uncharacterized protein n=1 Tax=Stephania cephalantha TaxID=152367 RepID=A0AAP0IB86_9MAGN